MTEIQALKDYLNTQPPGPITDESRVAALLAACWDKFEGSSESSMHPEKVFRIATPVWSPPIVEFWIERHGPYVMGSTRAELQKWSVDLERLTASIVETRWRALRPAAERLDVKPLAEDLARVIIEGRSDNRFTIQRDGAVRINIGVIVPETNAQTTQSRRKRFREHLAACLARHGWRPVRPNVFHRT